MKVYAVVDDMKTGRENENIRKKLRPVGLNTRTLPVEGSANDNGRTMVCAEYANTEGSPNPSG
jgi:hypothetical protein